MQYFQVLPSMMRWLIYMVWVGVFVAGSALHGQTWSHTRQQWIPVAEDTMVIDTLSLVANSWVLTFKNGDTIAPDTYRIDPAKATLVWQQPPAADTVKIAYSVVGYYFGRTYRNKSDTLINVSPTVILNPFVVDDGPEPSSVLDFGDLDYTGSFARGLSFGNRQDVVLNSSFNLQLSGILGNDVEVLAAMTDNNIPIQPEGNTQQLQDFDQVFIQLKRKSTQLTVGDFEWRTPDGYFLKYNKKLQGIAVETQADFPNAPNTSTKLRASAAIARGQFARNTFFGEEGNQGPYRLEGNNNEGFIIVLAGSERVYIDGQLMKRGAANDYVIDYNTGEITFTPNQLITKDKRIIVEFEYATQNYFRSLINAQNQWELGKLTLAVNLYSEQDARNQPVLETLDSARVAVMEAVGDSLQQAVFPGYDSVGYNSDQVRYRLTDTMVNGILYPGVLVFSTDPDSAVYQANFSFVGEGNGNYIIATNNTFNGRVYTWVAPEGGVPQGSYRPLVPLVTPQQRQMLSVRGQYQLSDRTSFGLEMAFTKRDVNTFSSIDDADDQGAGTFLQIRHTQPLRSDSGRQVALHLEGNYEMAGSRFRAIEVYRPMEFTRNWNTANLSIRDNQHLVRTSIALSGANFGTTAYQFDTYQIPGQYQGTKHGWQANLRWRSWRLTSQSSWLQTNGVIASSYFRPTLELSAALPLLEGWRAGVGYMEEDNRIRQSGSDSLLGSSFAFREWRYFLSAPDTSKTPLNARYISRIDRIPVLGRLPINNRGETFQLNGAILTNPRQQVRWTATYRSLTYTDTSGRDEQTALGRVQYQGQFVKGLFNLSTLYEVGTGQEPRREFAYVQVPDGQGTYVWNDDGDGVQELAEFEIASANDEVFANFIRIFTPTREFVRTNIVQLNQVIDIRPEAIAGESNHFLKKWSNILTVNLNRKVVATPGALQVNPFQLEVADTNLIAVSSLLRNSLYYNRFGTDLSGELTFFDSRNKQLLTNGPESRLLRYGELILRWVFDQKITAEIRGKRGLQGNRSAALSTRNYQFDFVEVSPKVTYQYQTKFRVSGSYHWAEKDNAPEYGAEKSTIRQFTLDGRYNVVTQDNINFSLSYANVTFNGSVNNSLAYAMLGGLQPGNNLLWSITWERRLANNIQISLTYDGRKTGDSPISHIGQAQVRAIF